MRTEAGVTPGIGALIEAAGRGAELRPPFAAVLHVPTDKVTLLEHDLAGSLAAQVFSRRHHPADMDIADDVIFHFVARLTRPGGSQLALGVVGRRDCFDPCCCRPGHRGRGAEPSGGPKPPERPAV